MTSKPSTLAEYVAELDRLIDQPLPSFDPMNPNSAMKFVKASILKNHRLNTAGVLRDLVEPERKWDDAEAKLSEVQQRLADLMGYITDEPEVESEPEPGQCWRVIKNGNIYRWNDVHPIDPVIEYWSTLGPRWVPTLWESFTAIEKEYGDLEPVENPENNA